jgi:hypothetical protein
MKKSFSVYPFLVAIFLLTTISLASCPVYAQTDSPNPTVTTEPPVSSRDLISLKLDSNSNPHIACVGYINGNYYLEHTYIGNALSSQTSLIIYVSTVVIVIVVAVIASFIVLSRKKKGQVTIYKS